MLKHIDDECAGLEKEFWLETRSLIEIDFIVSERKLELFEWLKA